MNLANEPKPHSKHQKIAILARELWMSEGSQSGRDLEYWLRAERQVLAAGENGKEPQKNGAKRKNSPVRA
jgi:hypothetical protein